MKPRASNSRRLPKKPRESSAKSSSRASIRSIPSMRGELETAQTTSTRRASEALDADPSTGITLLAVDLPPMDDLDSWYATIIRPLLSELRNPLAVLGHLSAATSAIQAAELREMGVPVLMGTETGLRATRHVVEYSAYQRDRPPMQNNNPVKSRARQTFRSCASVFAALRAHSASTTASSSSPPTGSPRRERSRPERSRRH